LIEKRILEVLEVLWCDLLVLAIFFEGKNLVLAVLPNPKFVAGPVLRIGRPELIKAF
jgi:hypothetical protein